MLLRQQLGSIGIRSYFLHQVESYYDIHVITTREKKRTPRSEAIKCRCVSVRKIFESGEAFLLSPLCAWSSNCQKSFRWASNMLSRSVSFVTGKSTAQERPFFVITTDFSDGSSL